MTPAQLRKLETLTNRLTRHARFSGGSWANGPVVFSISVSKYGQIIFQVSNATNERQWFESTYSATMAIGLRGGVRVYCAEGVSAWQIGPCTWKVKKA